MKFLIDKIFGSSDVAPPAKVKEGFARQFVDIKNVEWNRRSKDWEVIFYMEDRECIALLDDAGNLKELKKVLDINQIPSAISGKVKAMGEIMNIIEINKESVLSYEVIYRDVQMTRHLGMLDAYGNITHHKDL